MKRLNFLICLFSFPILGGFHGAAYGNQDLRSDEAQMFRNLCAPMESVLEAIGDDLSSDALSELKGMRQTFQSFLKAPVSKMREVLSNSVQDRELAALGLCAEIFLLEPEINKSEGCVDDESSEAEDRLSFSNAQNLCSNQVDSSW